MEKKKNSKGFKAKLILTNAITMLRAIGAIAIIPVFINFGGIAAACLVTGLFASDFVDGFLARNLKTSTFFGATLDASSDKIIGFASLAALLMTTKLALLPIALEMATLSVNYLKYKDKQNVRSYFSGKLKTFALSLGVMASFIISGLNDKNIIKDSSKLNALIPIFLGMATFESIALIQYIKDYVSEKKKKKMIDPEERVKQIEEEKRVLEEKKEYWKEYINTHEMNAIFDHELYEEKKHDADLSTEVKLYFSTKKEMKKEIDKEPTVMVDGRTEAEIMLDLQKNTLADLNELYEKNPEEAKKIVTEDLMKSGILNENLELKAPYNGEHIHSDDFTRGPKLTRKKEDN